MDFDADVSESLAIERRKVARPERRGVGRVIGACPRGLEPRCVCKIGNFACRLERGDERRKVVAIGCEQGRARRLRYHEDSRHRGEEFLAYDFLDDGETALERLHQA